jgi:hypothetical protein
MSRFNRGIPKSNIEAISLFFSLLRPRAGRFSTMKIAKQTKENSIKLFFFWNILLIVL